MSDFDKELTLARKQAYTAGFNVAKKSYTTKAMFDRLAIEYKTLNEILVTYKQTTGITDDLFVRCLEEWQQNLKTERTKDTNV